MATETTPIPPLKGMDAKTTTLPSRRADGAIEPTIEQTRAANAGEYAPRGANRFLYNLSKNWAVRLGLAGGAGVVTYQNVPPIQEFVDTRYHDFLQAIGLEIALQSPTEAELGKTGLESTPISEWPPEMAEMLEKLPLPEGLHLTRTTSETSPPPPFLECTLPEKGACYNPSTQEIWFLRGAPTGGELVTISHEVCHAHQRLQTIRSGAPNGDLKYWLQTPEGLAFMQAYEAFEVDAREVRARGRQVHWESFGPIEDFANICNGWYLSGLGFFDTANWPSLRQFAQAWLPK